ncbi:MAG TPA: ribosome silencing factor [Acholeplasmataceae bacterium]|nr:ribosome silencing factor [Acholeplasmataceae bacterium]
MINYKEVLLKKFQESNNPKAIKRYEHSLCVAKRAVEIIKEHNLNIDIKKAETAALLHDYAKFLTMDDFFEIVKENNLPSEILENDYIILHALLGPYVIKKELGIEDQEILDAVKYHTTGKANMDPLQEVLFVADFTEELRPNVENIREISKRDYKRAIALILEYTINLLISRKRKINPLSLEAFDYYRKYLVLDLSKIKKVVKTIEDDHNLVKDIKVYDARQNTPYYDFVIIATSPSLRQMKAAANYLKMEFAPRMIEDGDFWVLIDLNDIIIHIFLEEQREYYGLDKLLKDVPEIELD